MLDCFDGVTGLAKACGDPYAVSPVLPLESFGIDETMVGQFIQAEDTVASLIRDSEARARALMQTDVLTRSAKRIIPRTFLHAERVGEPDGHQTQVSGQSGMHGILIEVNHRNSNTKLTLTGLKFYADVTETVTVTVFDLNDGAEVGSFEIAAQAGKIASSAGIVTIQLARRSGSFFIAHDRTSWRTQKIGSGCSNCTGGAYKYGGVRVTGASLADSAAMIKSNLRTSASTGGLSVVVDCACDHGQYLCESRDLIIVPYVTKVAEMVIRRGIEAVSRINSQRLNLDILNDRADRLADEYVSAMNGLNVGAFMPGDDICFSCIRYSKVITSAP